MRFKEKVLRFFGRRNESESTANHKIYQEIAKDKPVIVHDSRTPIEDLISNFDPALKGLSKLKTPGERLKHIRMYRELTQAELAHLSGVSRSYIGDLERGEYDTTDLATACDISADLDVHVSDIWTKVVTK